MVSKSLTLNHLRTDLRSAWQGVVGGRFALIVAIVALAVGTGASLTAAVVAYGGLLRPLPFPDEERLMTLAQVYAPTSITTGLKLNEFDRWRERMAGSLQLAARTNAEIGRAHV